MALIEVKLEVQGDEELAKAFELMRSRVNDWRPFWPDIAAVFYIGEKALLDSQGYGRWEPLSDGYKAWKTKHYPGEQMMQLTGDLYRSLTTKWNPHAVYELEALSMTLGTTVPYAAAHQYGYAPRNLPARVIMDVTETDINIMGRVAVESFDRYAQNLGFETTKD